MKLYIIAGEASGDLHGSNLIRSIRSENSNIDFRCWGGDKMKNAGGNVVKHINELAFMGFIEVLVNLKTILSNISFCKSDIVEYAPDAIVLIDYPGFNLRIAEWAKKIKFLFTITFHLKFGLGINQEFIKLKGVLIRCTQFYHLKKNFIGNSIMKLIM